MIDDEDAVDGDVEELQAAYREAARTNDLAPWESFKAALDQDGISVAKRADGGSGTGSRADTPRDELDPELTVYVEIIGEDIESGHTVIHDPDYLEPPGEYVEMPLQEAEAVADEFCVDCFTAAHHSQLKGVDE